MDSREEISTEEILIEREGSPVPRHFCGVEFPTVSDPLVVNNKVGSVPVERGGSDDVFPVFADFTETNKLLEGKERTEMHEDLRKGYAREYLAFRLARR
jgi:hypothetical protein